MVTKKAGAPKGVGTMLVSEAARELGVAAKTVRDWTAAGKLDCQRTPGGMRLYDVGQVRKFKETRDAR